MKLQNKKTGEIAVFGEGIVDLNKIGCKNVAEMMEAGWEDYEETALDEMIEKLKNDFEKYPDEWNNLEDAKKIVKRLEAFTKLKKEKGFKFTGFDGGRTYIDFTFDKPGEPGSAYKDLDLLFGGEE